MDDIIQGIRILLLCILSGQLMYGFLIVLFEETMTNFYALGIYEPPNNLFQKITNLFMLVTIGSGYHIYLKLRKYSWLIRKFLFLIALFIQAIAFVIIYKTIYGVLKVIFL
ncbi:hypothetical protein [Peribacillus sp. NPDC097295]|uniref:hypothetical protein n=1 Tax=Peribacillus sp. NPDC097295 TaxID=3364402 RepID=UPI0037F34772